VGITHSRTPRLEHPAKPFIEELLGPADFACREGEDEFLIVCPGLHGSEAQRRLNEISERLWNFQLRGQGSFSVLFSWGGIGIENEPLSEAIASATGRMQQTKRSRVVLFRRKAG
jgi:GGDEF domain-containing protein